MVRDVLSLPGLQLSGKAVCLQALDLYGTHNISFADAYNAAYALSEKISNVYSWDKDFDKIEGIVRLEPE